MGRRPPSKKGSAKGGGESHGAKRGWLGRFLGFLVLLAIWGGVAMAGVIAYYAYDLPDVRQAVKAERRPAVTLLADGGEVLARYGDNYGRAVRLAAMPPMLVKAVLAIEDRRFYNHFGVDPIGLIRAAVTNLFAGHVVQGGSTLTQQLAKNLFLSPDRTFRRKVQEMLLALWLEHTYSKNEILTAYLNRVYLGSGSYGVDAAAETYFGKPVEALSLRECAIIAGLLRAPSRYSPLNSPDEAMARAKVVLAAMEDDGAITEAERQAALADAPLPRRKPGAGGDGHYFADWIMEQVGSLLEQVPQDITVETTLDMRLQRVAERRLDAVLAVEGPAARVAQGAAVTLAPDGAVRVMAGGRDYDASQFNRATQAMRQPGSAFKPVIYLTALEQGMTPSDMFDDAPISVNGWSPENYDGKYRGPITARQALAESVNTVAVRVLQKAGIPAVVRTARALGITDKLDSNLSLALGTNVLTPLELTAAYATLASGGRAVAPYGIRTIKSRDGKILYRRQAAHAPVVVPPAAVETLVSMMQDVIAYGTGKRAALGRPAAGKTGTSSDYRDAWFVGFTADYVTGVWLGNDDNAPMKKVTGGSLPAGLWRDIMVDAENGLPERALLSGTEDGASGQGAATSSGGGSDLLGDFIRVLTGDDDVKVEKSYPGAGR